MSDARTGVLELTLGDTYIGSAYSPQVEVTDTDTGHEVAITYMSPSGLVTERFEVADGEQGPQGPAGYSPTVTITDTATGHTVTITDADGPHSYDVPNYAQEEQERQDAWDTLSGEVTDAISDAETATSAASTAATSATSAASSATSAAQAATTAAASATTAASSANAAANAANSAATAAGTAADAATTAAGDATDAASAANTAAQAAQEAATEVAPEVAWLWGNQLTGDLTGDLLTAADAYAAPPMALVVDGRSTQDGTPTPDVPVPIESVDELALTFAGKNLLDESLLLSASGWTATDGVYRGTVASLYQKQPLNPITPVAGPLTFSYDFRYVSDSALSPGNGIRFDFLYTDGTSESNTYTNRSISFMHYTHHVPAGKVLCGIGMGYMLAGTVELRNIQLEVGSTATAYEPYLGRTVPLLPDGYSLRSLPDGTRDTLALTYLRPSTREGWAWYSRELVQNLGRTVYDGTQALIKLSDGNFAFQNPAGMFGEYGYTTTTQSLSERFKCHAAYNGRVEGEAYVWSNYTYFTLADTYTTVEEAAEWLLANEPEFIAHLATPVTTDLVEIELPVLPAPECTVWADSTTGLQMSYVRDTNIVIANLEAAYADLATS